MSEGRVLALLLEALEKARKHNFKLLIRTDGFKLVGIMTSKRAELDPSRGETRTWAVGVDLKGKEFKEPLDRLNKATEKYELVAVETPYLVITARKRPEGEEDDNFLFFDTILDAESQRRLIRELEERNRTIASLQRKLDEASRIAEFWRTQCEAESSYSRELKSRLSALLQELYILRGREESYRQASLMFIALETQIEAAIRRLIEVASERGVELAKSELERAEAALRNLRRLREEAEGITGMPYVMEEIEKLREEIKRSQEGGGGPPAGATAQGKPQA